MRNGWSVKDTGYGGGKASTEEGEWPQKGRFIVRNKELAYAVARTAGEHAYDIGLLH
ncbi:MAG: hypothetical protein ABI813_15515 [Bacteroidota bacterium]